MHQFQVPSGPMEGRSQGGLGPPPPFQFWGPGSQRFCEAGSAVPSTRTLQGHSSQQMPTGGGGRSQEEWEGETAGES